MIFSDIIRMYFRHFVNNKIQLSLGYISIRRKRYEPTPGVHLLLSITSLTVRQQFALISNQRDKISKLFIYQAISKSFLESFHLHLFNMDNNWF